MRLRERFRLDHEPGDTPADTVRLEQFRARGIELGAEVTVWACAGCGVLEALFHYPDDRRPA